MELRVSSIFQLEFSFDLSSASPWSMTMKKRYVIPSILTTITLCLIPSLAYCLPAHRLRTEEEPLILENAIRDLVSQISDTSSLWLDLCSSSAADWDSNSSSVVERRGPLENLGSNSQHYLGSAAPSVDAYLSEFQRTILQNARDKEGIASGILITDTCQGYSSAHAAPGNNDRIPLSWSDSTFPPQYLYDTILPKKDRHKPDPASSGWRKAFMSLTIFGGALAGASFIGGVGRMAYNRYRGRKWSRSGAGEKVSISREQEKGSSSDPWRTGQAKKQTSKISLAGDEFGCR